MRKFQIPNLKFQINSKLQFQMSQKVLFRISNFGHWELFGIWCLAFGAFHSVWFQYILFDHSCNMASIDFHPHFVGDLNSNFIILNARHPAVDPARR